MSPNKFIAAIANVNMIRANSKPTFKIFYRAKYRVFNRACKLLLALTILKSLATLMILNTVMLNKLEIESSIETKLSTTIVKSKLLEL